MPLLLLNFLMVQAFGCYHLARGCRVSVFLGCGGCFFFSFKLVSDGRRKKEAGVWGKFRGVPEVRAAQRHYAYLPFLLVCSLCPGFLQTTRERGPGPGERCLSLPPPGAPTSGRAPSPRSCALVPPGRGGGIPLRQRAGPRLISGRGCENPGCLIISPRRRVCVCLISH